MKQWFSKILFFTITLSFFVSATEMDLGECHNTFFDEYDTYVKTEQLSIDHATSLQQEHDTYALIWFVSSEYQTLQEQSQNKQYSDLAFYNHYPPKLFLRNSVWRI